MKALMTNKTLHGHLFALLLIAATGLFLQRGYMNEYPTHIHAWAEQDHYALALGFINNGFDFFHPETMIYNKQFPGWWKEAYDNTITSADFPIHHFIVAIQMRFFGTTSPWVFRVYTLIISLIGLFFLFKTAFHITNNIPKSIIVTSIAFTTPVYAYYCNGFLPGIPAFSMSIIGFWFYVNFLDSNRKVHYVLSIAFLCLSALMRTTFIIALIATLCYGLLRIAKKESTFKGKLPIVILSLAVFVAYYLWNKHLRQCYGSLFLGHLLPPENLKDAKELLNIAYDNWRFQYFQRFHYQLMMVFALIAVSIFIIRFFRKKNQETSKIGHEKSKLSLWWLPLGQLFGCLLFTIAMMQQIQYHDYYFIDTFFAPLLITIILILKAIPSPQKNLLIGMEYAIAVTVSVVMIQHVVKDQTYRRIMEDAALVTYNCYKDSDQLLDSLHIPNDAKMLCIYGYAQNGPFIQMKRKGYIVMNDKDDLLKTALTWDYDYIVIENAKYEEHFDNQKEIFSKLQKIGGDNKITIYTMTDIQ